MEGKDYRKTAEEIIRIVGKDNIVSATHCATRLRLIVKDKEAIDVKKLEKLPLVKGTFSMQVSSRSFWEPELSIKYMKK